MRRKKTFKAIIIGCGKIGGYFDNKKDSVIYSHAQGYFKNPNITVVDYVDKDISKASSLAKKYNSCNCSRDAIASINKNSPDVVSVCTPDNTHFGIIKRMLKNRIVPKLIFVEKPVCLQKEELRFLQKQSVKKGVKIIINHSRRFSPKYALLRKLIKKNKFGRPVRIDVFYYGGFKHNGVHVIDTLMFLFNDKLAVRKATGRLKNCHQGDPTIDMVLDFKKNNARVYLHAFDERYYQIFDFDLKFEKARLRIENFESSFLLENKIRNSMGENVLVGADLNFGSNYSTCMQNAISIIVKYLKTKNNSFIQDYTINKAKDTMNVIWSFNKCA